MVSQADRDAIAAAIDTDELTELALTLGNIPSRSGEEKAAGDFVHDWMAREGFAPRKVGATEDRFNVIGTYGRAMKYMPTAIAKADATSAAPAPVRPKALIRGARAAR